MVGYNKVLHVHVVDSVEICKVFVFPKLQKFQVVYSFYKFMHDILYCYILYFSIDKALHSMGPKLGYALPKRSLPNPLDIVLVFCQQVSV